GAVSGFATALERFGTMSFKEVLEPAIYYAEKGFPVSELVGSSWFRAVEKLQTHKATAKNYLPKGVAPRIGETFYSKDIAETFKLIAKGGAEEFYKGSIAKKIVEFSEKNNGFFTLENS
ncbi:MAG: gamma-glutamyltransferase, partial [Candidatus Heimdallarchaeota archaeon]